MPNNPKPQIEVEEKTSLSLKAALVLGMVSAFLVGVALVNLLFPQTQEKKEVVRVLGVVLT